MSHRLGKHWHRLLLRCFALALTLSLLTFGCAPAVNLDQARQFEEAGEAMRTAESTQDYLEVAAQYEHLLQSGIESGVLWYNLGNAYAQGGQRGRALAAYRQALRYRPNDPYLQGNLDLTRNALAVPPRPESRWLQLVFWHGWFAYPTKFWIVAALGSLTLLLALARWLQPAAAKLWRPLSFVAFAATLLVGISLAIDLVQFEWQEHGVIIAPEVTARKGSSTTYEPAFTEALSEGTEFTVLQRQADWLHIRIDSDLDGWIPVQQAITF